MAQLDVFRVDRALLLDIQNDLLADFRSRIVVPLLPPGVAPIAHRRLNPLLQVQGRGYHMVTQFLAAMPLNELGQPVDNLDRDYDRIKAAIDMVFLGF